MAGGRRGGVEKNPQICIFFFLKIYDSQLHSRSFAAAAAADHGFIMCCVVSLLSAPKGGLDILIWRPNSLKPWYAEWANFCSS